MTLTTIDRLLHDRRALLAAGARLEVEPGSRCWAHLVADEQFDAWLIAWGPGSELEPHDHGGSSGSFHLLRGRLIETYADPGDRAAFAVREIVAGQTIAVPATRIHEVHNPAAQPALSLHVYSPALAPMRYFPAFGETR